MSQYALGTVAVTQGSATVTGTGTKWTTFIAVGSLFTVRDTGITYQIASIASDTSLTLVAPYGGNTGTGLEYAVSDSFTPYYGIPYVNPQDIEAAAILKASIQAIEALVKQCLSPEVLAITTNQSLNVNLHRNRILVVTSGVTVTLPDSSTVESGWRVAVMSTSATVQRAGTDTIDGATSKSVTSVKWFTRTAAGVWVSYSLLGTESAVPALTTANETAAGVLEVATQGETDAGAADDKIVTPAKLAAYGGRVRKYAANIGNGALTSIDVVHNLGTRDVHVSIYDNSTFLSVTPSSIARATTSKVTVTFASAPGSGAYRAVVIG